MHTVMMIGGGLVVLAIFMLVGRSLGGGSARAAAKSALWFVPVWLVVAVINLAIGVSRAGYTVAEELPILLVVFGLPAAVALIFWRKFSKGPA